MKFAQMKFSVLIKSITLLLFGCISFGASAQLMPIVPGAAGTGLLPLTGGGMQTPALKGIEGPTEAARLTSRAITLDPLKPNDFQQFILQTTGQRLPLSLIHI